LQAKGSERLQDVARLFSLSELRVLADNRGVVTNAEEALGGKSILLCGQFGEWAAAVAYSIQHRNSLRCALQHGRALISLWHVAVEGVSLALPKNTLNMGVWLLQESNRMSARQGRFSVHSNLTLQYPPASVNPGFAGTI